MSVFQWAQLLSGAVDDSKHYAEYTQDFVSILSNANMDAFFFETKGVTYSTASEKAFEFVLVESTYLYKFADVEQDPLIFGEHFAQCTDAFGCVFPSLGGDSMLIAPKPTAGMGGNVYGHLAAFVRRAPKDQVIQFWKLVMETYLRRIDEIDPEMVWLSTDGTGVAWLHIRLDPRPKYYDYTPFANGTEDLLDHGGKRMLTVGARQSSSLSDLSDG
jgi:hypothetical protein